MFQIKKVQNQDLTRSIDITIQIRVKVIRTLMYHRALCLIVRNLIFENTGEIE